MGETFGPHFHRAKSNHDCGNLSEIYQFISIHTSPEDENGGLFWGFMNWVFEGMIQNEKRSQETFATWKGSMASPLRNIHLLVLAIAIDPFTAALHFSTAKNHDFTS